MAFYKTRGTRIVAPDGKTVQLKGVNLGGWLMMEGYILQAPNIAVQVFKKDFSKTLGATALKEFEEAFAGHFIQEEDFRLIADIGFNCVRLPFHHRLIEPSPFTYDPKGVRYLDQAIAWSKKYRLGVILDLHGAYGSQNHDWHSDSTGDARLWKVAACRERTYALWEFLAERYRNETTIVGYDLLNEPVMHDPALLNRFYRELIGRIRTVDWNHILFIEGNRWAQDVALLDDFDDSNYALSIHYYEPLELTFNFVPHLSYPIPGGFNKAAMRGRLAPYAALAEKRGVPVFLGEFGVNARKGLFKEHHWVRDAVSCCREFGFHWTYWTYKAVKNSTFPDGLYSYLPNAPWVNRMGPKTGWETYARLWPMHKLEMTESWTTEHFTPNDPILEVLRRAL